MRLQQNAQNDTQAHASVGRTSLSQQDVDRIVKRRVGAMKKKYKHHASTLRDIVLAIAKEANLHGDEDAVVAQLARRYNVQGNVKEDNAQNDDALQTILLQACDLLSDEEVLTFFSNLEGKGQWRNNEEGVMYTLLSPRVKRIRNAICGDAFIKTFHTVYPDVDVWDLLKDEGFADFCAMTHAPLLEAYSCFCKIKDRAVKENGVAVDRTTAKMSDPNLANAQTMAVNRADAQTANALRSTGSVRSSGKASMGGYFTKEEVQNMSAQEVRKHLSKIQQSIPKWGKSV